MEGMILWPEWPVLSIAFLVAVSMVFLYLAREPMQRVFKAVVEALGGGFQMVARWSYDTADRLRERNREVLVESKLSEMEGRIEQEFERIDAAYTRNLADYPRLHRKLDEHVSALDADYETTAELPPEAPGWGEVVEAIGSVREKADDRVIEKMLGEIHKSALDGEKRALSDYRQATAKRHKILSSMAPHLKALKSLLGRVEKSTTAAVEATDRIDGYMDRYERIRAGEDKTVRLLSASSIKLFIISLLVVGIAVGGAFINFQLIALPMSELVPSGARIAGMPVATVAALVIVLMEIAAGIFLLDTLGITELFPQLGTLSKNRRRVIAVAAFLGLFLLAAIESSLAILREQLVAAEMVLQQQLAGEGVAEVSASKIPVIGQAVLGFVLPWILAMVAVPLEMLMDSGRHVGGKLTVAGVLGVGYLVRLLAYVVQYAVLLLSHLYDAWIVIPLRIEQAIRGHEKPAGPTPMTREELETASANTGLTDPAVRRPVAGGDSPEAVPPGGDGGDSGRTQ